MQFKSVLQAIKWYLLVKNQIDTPQLKSSGFREKISKTYNNNYGLKQIERALIFTKIKKILDALPARKHLILLSDNHQAAGFKTRHAMLNGQYKIRKQLENVFDANDLLI